MRNSTMKILIVEDDLTGRLILQSFLLRLGTIETAPNGTKALYMVEKAMHSTEYYSLICLDINMDGMNGIEVLKNIRKLEKGNNLITPAKILMTSATNSVEAIRGSLDGECNGYLLKPFDKESLMEHLVMFNIIDEEQKAKETRY